ncbi:hypothetical protein [Lysobacter sp. HA35]
MNSKCVLAFAISVALASSAAHAGTLVRAQKNRIDNQYIVVFNPSRLSVPRRPRP